MPGYKLTYFPSKGRAEVCRLIFAAADQPYEDVRLGGEKWQELKPSTPFGCMPLLEFDGLTLCQSNAMARFLAKHFGLAGKTDVEAAMGDMIVDTTEDILTPLVKIVFEKDEAKQAELKKKFTGETLPPYLKNMEKLLASNNGGVGYMVGDGLTWADIHLSASLALLPDVDWASYPKLKALKDRVEANPGIAKWMRDRPVTQY